MKFSNTFRKTVALLVAVVMIAITIPFAYAADPEVHMIDGQRTVFVAKFGKMNYEGKAYVSYKTLAEAFEVLGKEGGSIIFSGTHNMAEFTDIKDRAPVSLIGVGTKETGNILTFPEGVSSLDLGGDLFLDFMVLQIPEGFTINTNGYSLSVGATYDTYYYIPDYTTGIRQYGAFPSVATGKNGGDSNISLAGGKFENVGIGGVTEAGSSGIIVSGGEYQNVYAGISDAAGGTVNGNINLKVVGGTVENVVAGSYYDGTVNGNVSVEVSGGDIKNISIGSKTSAAKINGNIVISIKNAFYNNITTNANGIVTGKVIITSDREQGIVEGTKYDHYIVTDGGIAKPMFDGTCLLGFSFTDKNGCISEKVTLEDGTPLIATNGVFTLPEGFVKLKVESDIVLELNKYAKYVSGYEDGTFLPQNNLTRAEAITMLVRLVTDETKIKGKVLSNYDDVEKGAWYESYIGFFEGLGYLNTIAKRGGTKIAPNDKITRGEFVEVARNVLYLLNPRDFSVKSFIDVSESHPYYKSIGEIGSLGVVGGYEDGTFKPDNLITRAEVVTIINRMLSRGLTGAAGGTVFADSADHWAKDQILMAANPANVGGVDIWTITGDVTKGKFELIEGGTLDEQYVKLYALAKNGGTDLDITSGIDTISNWQIDNIAYSSSDYSTITGNMFYISPNGDDNNDGLSPETAWKSLSKTADPAVKRGDGVLFERGATFRGSFNAKEGVTYSAYGTGEKPRIYGSAQNYADPSLWEPVKGVDNVWKLTKIITADVGIMVFDCTEEIGNYNELCGRKIINENTKPQDLTQDLQFTYNFGRTYLYSKENPGERFDSIEIGTRTGIVIISGNDIVINNLHFRYTGAHVVGTGNRQNITSKNCIYAYSGGSVLSGTTLYGNAFESYGGCDGWYAYNNWIYQIYDTGVTHQYTPTEGECVQKNVEYIGNVIEYCHWAIEYYNRDSTDGSQRVHENIRIDNNICRMNGYGWGSRGRTGGSTMFCSAIITKYTKNFTATHNILDRGAGNIINIYSDGDKALELKETLFVQRNGGSMGHMKEGYVACDKNVVKNVAASTVEDDPVIIVNNDTNIINNIKKYV